MASIWSFWTDKNNSQIKDTIEHTKPRHSFFVSNDEEESRVVGEALECDYERDCSNLYRQIEEEKFGPVLDFLNTGYWPGAFFADPVTPSDQTRTWVTRFEYKEEKRVRWSQLPLHIAIVVEAPLVLISRLVELYPQATRCTDDQRMLPLHLALRHGSKPEVVAYLLKKFPEAVNVRGGKGEGRLPVEYAVRGPNKALGDILETFVEKSKAKATKVAAKNHAKDLEFLQAKLQAKEFELKNVQDKLTSLDVEKASLQRELAQKRNELLISMQSMEKLSALKLKEIEDGYMGQEEVQKHLQNIQEKSVDDLETEQKALEKRIEAIEEKKVELEDLGSVVEESIKQLQDQDQKARNRRAESEHQDQKTRHISTSRPDRDKRNSYHEKYNTPAEPRDSKKRQSVKERERQDKKTADSTELPAEVATSRPSNKTETKSQDRKKRAEEEAGVRKKKSEEEAADRKKQTEEKSGDRKRSSDEENRAEKSKRAELQERGRSASNRRLERRRDRKKRTEDHEGKSRSTNSKTTTSNEDGTAAESKQTKSEAVGKESLTTDARDEVVDTTTAELSSNSEKGRGSGRGSERRDTQASEQEEDADIPQIVSESGRKGGEEGAVAGSSMSEITSLRSEVSRLQQELEKKSMEEKSRHIKKPVRTKTILRRRGGASLHYTPTV